MTTTPPMTPQDRQRKRLCDALAKAREACGDSQETALLMAYVAAQAHRLAIDITETMTKEMQGE